MKEQQATPELVEAMEHLAAAFEGAADGDLKRAMLAYLSTGLPSGESAATLAGIIHERSQHGALAMQEAGRFLRTHGLDGLPEEPGLLDAVEVLRHGSPEHVQELLSWQGKPVRYTRDHV